MHSRSASNDSIAALMHAHDWSKTSIGDPDSWPDMLRHLAKLVIGSRLPMFVLWGPEYAYLYNDGCVPILGERHPGLLGQRLPEAWPEAWVDLGPLTERAFGGEAVCSENRPMPVFRDGRAEDAWFTFCCSPVRDEAEDVVGMFAAAVETTAQVRVQHALHESDEHYRHSVELHPQVCWTATADGRVDHVAKRWRDWTGNAGLGEAWREAVHHDDLSRTDSAWLRSASTGLAYDVELRVRRTSGEFRWVRSRASPRRLPSGEIVKWYGVTEDIDDCKRAEGALRALEGRLESEAEMRTRERDRLWRNAPDLLVVLRPDGVIEAANAAWERLLAYQPDALPGRNIASLVHEEDREGLKRALLADHARTAEARLRHEDGSYRWFAWRWTTEDGHVYASGRDITAEREAAHALQLAEEQLRQMHKMEAIGQLTGGLAHDLNNILTGIIGSLDLMRRRIGEGRTSDIERYAATAMLSAERAAALTHRLLAFSRRQPLDPRAVDPRLLVARMLELLRRTLGEQVALEVEAAADLWPAHCDPNQLENALLNLAVNARDAMPDGGRLTIRLANLTVAADAGRPRQMRPGDYVEIAVRDTGVGMSPEVMARAFDPFFTTKPLGQGTGLGLSMIYGFARQSEGYARIESEVGQGSSVHLFLPRADTGASAHSLPAPADAAPRQPPTILVVEDEAAVRELVVELLKDEGYSVLEAADGQEGLATIVAGRQLHLVLTDVGLPGMNGHAMAEAARRLRPELPILFMTGYAKDAARAAGFLEPGMEMITKPFSADLLLSRVRRMLGAGSDGEDR